MSLVFPLEVLPVVGNLALGVERSAKWPVSHSRPAVEMQVVTSIIQQLQRLPVFHLTVVVLMFQQLQRSLAFYLTVAVSMFQQPLNLLVFHLMLVVWVPVVTSMPR
jgi:hypothetical protein